MKKASPDRPATQNEAKVVKISEIEAVPTKKCSGIYLVLVTDFDPDPMDWNDLDSFSNKHPVKERKPRKPAYRKPQAVKEFEGIMGRKYRDDTANGMMRLVIDFIKHHGGQAERNNTMGVPVDKRRQVTDVLGHNRMIGGIEWRNGGGTNGSADISATIRGRSVKIEVKIGKDRQSHAQRQYQQAVEAAGGIYYVAKDFTSFVQWYKKTIMEGGTR